MSVRLSLFAPLSSSNYRNSPSLAPGLLMRLRGTTEGRRVGEKHVFTEGGRKEGGHFLWRCLSLIANDARRVRDTTNTRIHEVARGQHSPTLCFGSCVHPMKKLAIRQFSEYTSASVCVWGAVLLLLLLKS